MARLETVDAWMVCLAWFKDYRQHTVLADLISRTKDGGWVVGWAH